MALLIYYVDLTCVRNRNAVWMVKLPIAGAAATSLQLIIAVRVETLDAIVPCIHHVDLARMGNHNAVWKVKLAGAAAVATSLIEKRDLRGHRVDQLRL